MNSVASGDSLHRAGGFRQTSDTCEFTRGLCALCGLGGEELLDSKN